MSKGRNAHHRDNDEVGLDTARIAMNLVRVHAQEFRQSLTAEGLQSEEHRKQLRSSVAQIKANIELIEKWLGGAVPPEPAAEVLPADETPAV